MAYDGNYLTMHETDSSKNGPRVFAYRTTDAKATLQASGYVSDGQERGMRFGDIVWVQRVTTGTLDAPTAMQTGQNYVSAVSAAGAATLDDLVTLA
jgi:hypothetical protein